jgi:23S rRNA (adenine-N6)-dimethyltransferase
MYKNLMNRQEEVSIKVSQNFIHSAQLAERVIKKACFNREYKVIEIGPGKGIFTKSLLRNDYNVIAVEKDSHYVDVITENIADKTNLEIVQTDFLRYPLPRNEKYSVFSNLPFNVTTQMLQKVLGNINSPQKAVFILQREAFERYESNSLISLEFSPWYEIKKLMKFEQSDFTPMPTVNTVLAEFTLREYPEVDIKDRADYLDFITYIFKFSNPTLHNALRKVFTDKQIEFIRKNLKRDLKVTPARLLSADWCKIFNSYNDYCTKDKKIMIRGSFKRLNKEQSNIEKVFRSRVKFKFSKSDNRDGDFKR